MMNTVTINKQKNMSHHPQNLTLADFKPKQKAVYQVSDLNLWYDEVHALKNINLSIGYKEVTAIIGPSGCGKSSFLKTLNRMVELVPEAHLSGEINYHERNILCQSFSVEELRTQVGMVFQKPNPFPKSIYENIVYGPRIHGIRNKKILDDIVEHSLRRAYLWEEVKDRLKQNAYDLSGGQQQRLCIARCLAINPDVILMDEPTSALDPNSTLQIEKLIKDLKEEYSIVIVTHNMQQAARISDKTAFFLNGEIIEYDKTNMIFTNPYDQRTDDYINGQFG